MHRRSVQFDPDDIQIDEAIWFVSNDDKHHAVLELDLRMSKKRILAGWRRPYRDRLLFGDTVNENEKSLLIPDYIFLVRKSNRVVDRRSSDEIETPPESGSMGISMRSVAQSLESLQNLNSLGVHQFAPDTFVCYQAIVVRLVSNCARALAEPLLIELSGSGRSGKMSHRPQARITCQQDFSRARLNLGVNRRDWPRLARLRLATSPLLPSRMV